MAAGSRSGRGAERAGCRLRGRGLAASRPMTGTTHSAPLRCTPALPPPLFDRSSTPATKGRERETHQSRSGRAERLCCDQKTFFLSQMHRAPPRRCPNPTSGFWPASCTTLVALAPEAVTSPGWGMAAAGAWLGRDGIRPSIPPQPVKGAVVAVGEQVSTYPTNQAERLCASLAVSI